MTTAISEIVSVSVTQATATVSAAGFGMPIILGTSTPIGGAWTERTRSYTSMTGVAEDFLSSDSEYKACAAIFAQDIHPASVTVGRRDANVAAVKNIVFSGPLVTSNVINGTVNGVAIAETTYATSHAATMSALAVLIAAMDGVASCTVSTNTLIVTATAGYELSLADFVVTAGAGQVTATYTVTTAGKTVASELSLIQVEDDSWYCVLLTSYSDADILTAAAWVEARPKLGLFRSNDTGIIDTTETDVAFKLDALGYNRSAVIYHETPGEHIDAAWAGRCLPLDPGSETWKFKTVTGVVASSLTSTQAANAQGKHANIYRTIGGVDVMTEGYCASGRFIDQTRFIDWLIARMQERIFSTLISVPKIPYTDQGIAIIENLVRAQLAEGVAVGGLANDPAPTVSVPAVSAVSSTNRGLRSLPSVTFTGRLAGAIHNIDIAGTVTV